MDVIVIGAGQGLGLELVLELNARGHRVVAGLRRTEDPDAIAQLALKDPNRVSHTQCDVTSEAQLCQAASYAERILGKADSVINCAGVLLDDDRKNPLYQTDIEGLRNTFEVNLIGAVAAVSLVSLLETGEIHNKRTQYMDYKGDSMMPKR